VFSRARDIIAANMTELLDRAEDPARMIRVIIAEMDVSLKGLGGLIQNFGDAFQTSALMAAIITSSLVGVVGTVALEMLRRKIAPWADRVHARVEA